MGASNGPVSTLPGAFLRVPHGTKCDNHPERLAVRCVQGETDSFGCEYEYQCAECVEAEQKRLTAYQEELKAGQVTNWCDHCKAEIHEEVYPARDLDEGMAGPVYYLCASHRQKLRAYNSED